MGNVMFQCCVTVQDDKESESFLDWTAYSDSVIATRYFTDSGIIGAKAFVAAQYRHFKHLFPSNPTEHPKRLPV